MTSSVDYRPSAAEPLLILAMDHRASSGRSLSGVGDGQPDPGQQAAMQAAKQLIYAGLARARGQLPGGRPGVPTRKAPSDHASSRCLTWKGPGREHAREVERRDRGGG